MPFLPQCRSRVCWALLLHARRTPKQNLGCTTGNCNLLVPLVVARVIRPLSWISFTACIVPRMFTLTCVARLGDGLCRNTMLATSPDCGPASFWIGCCRGLGGKMCLRVRVFIRCIHCNGIAGTRCSIRKTTGLEAIFAAANRVDSRRFTQASRNQGEG